MVDIESKPRLGSYNGFVEKVKKLLDLTDEDVRKRHALADATVDRFLAECRADPDLPTYYKTEHDRAEAWRAENPHRRLPNSETMAEFGEIESEVRTFYCSRVRQVILQLKQANLEKVPEHGAYLMVALVNKMIQEGRMI